MDKDVKVIDIALLNIRAGLNLRTVTNKKEDEILTTSIKESGIANLIKLRNALKEEGEDPAFKYILDGHRRYRSAIAAGMVNIKALDYGDVSRKEATLFGVLSNCHQNKMSDGDLMRSVDILLKEGWSANAIQRALNTRRQKALAITNVAKKGSKKIKDAVISGELSPVVAGAIVALPAKEQDKVLPKVVNKPAAEGLATVRKREFKFPKFLKPNRPKIDYEKVRNRGMAGIYLPSFKLVPHIVKLVQDIEYYTKYRLESVNIHNATYKAYLELIDVLKGEIKLIDLFPDARIPEYEQSYKPKKRTVRERC